MCLGYYGSPAVPLPSFPVLLALVYQLAVSPSYTLPGAPMNLQTKYLHADWNGRALLSNHEAECYMDSSVGENPFVLATNDGVLNLNATPAKSTNPCYSAYNSGMITTQGIFSCQYCYYEARIRLPTGSGLWPAFWLLSEANDGAYVGEVDAFENPQGPNTGAPSPIALHVGEVGVSSSGTFTTYGAWIDQLLPVGFDPTIFHNYGVQVGPATTTYFVDRVAVATNLTPASLAVELYPIINLAVGYAASWPGLATFTGTKSLRISALRAWATGDTVSVNGTAYTSPPVP